MAREGPIPVPEIGLEVVVDVIEETVRAIKLDLLGPAKHPCGWKAIRMCSAPARQYKASRQKYRNPLGE